MKDFNAGLIGRAALTRIDRGDDLTWPVVAERIDGFGKGLTKDELVQVVGYLAARLIQTSRAAA